MDQKSSLDGAKRDKRRELSQKIPEGKASIQEGANAPPIALKLVQRTDDDASSAAARRSGCFRK